MAAVTDFIHDEEIVEAVLYQLAAELPVEWTAGDSPLFRLRRLEFGDLREQRLEPGQTWRDICPGLLVRLNRSESAPEYGGLGGKAGQVVPLRVLYFCGREQCQEPGTGDAVAPARIRARHAKIISRALFAHRDLGNPALTTQDGFARVVELRPKAVFYEGDGGDIEAARKLGLVALAIDCEVVVRTQ
jgi:hypothetical protein